MRIQLDVAADGRVGVVIVHLRGRAGPENHAVVVRVAGRDAVGEVELRGLPFRLGVGARDQITVGQTETRVNGGRGPVIEVAKEGGRCAPRAEEDGAGSCEGPHDG